jgi:hypothetical protein
MSKEKLQTFMDEQFEDLDEFSFTLEEEDKYIYANFTEILGKFCNKEMTFKIINEKLQYHSFSYGWKIIDIKKNYKYFWIDLLEK